MSQEEEAAGFGKIVVFRGSSRVVVLLYSTFRRYVLISRRQKKSFVYRGYLISPGRRARESSKGDH